MASNRMVTTRRLTIGLGCTVLLSATFQAHEVSVHEAITDKAVDYLVQQNIHPELADASCPRLKSLLRQGVRDEDNNFHQWPIGRFFFHFSPELSDVVVNRPGDYHVVTDATCDSVTWGHTSNPCTATITDKLTETKSGPWSNEFSYDRMVADLRTALGTSTHDRGLVGLGHYLHLLQDLTSPAHVRQDGHPHLDAPVIGTLGDPQCF